MKLEKPFASSVDAWTTKQRITTHFENSGYRRVASSDDSQLKFKRGSIGGSFFSGKPSTWKCRAVIHVEPQGMGTKVLVSLDIALKRRMAPMASEAAYWDNEVRNLEAVVNGNQISTISSQESAHRLSKVNSKNVVLTAVIASAVTGIFTVFNPVGTAVNWVNQQSWKEFKSLEGGYSICMPGAPKLETRLANTAAGPVDLHFASVDQQSVSYGVAYGDYPVSLVQASVPEKILDGVRNGMVSGLQGTLLAEEIISNTGNPGRDLRVATPDGKGTVRCRIFLVKNRVFQLIVVTTKEKSFSNNILKFLDSFKLTEN